MTTRESGPYTKRRDSEYDGEDINFNVGWLNSRWSLVTLGASILAFRWALDFFPFVDSQSAWTLTVLAHFLITFFTFHHMKGTPMWMYQGEFDDQTFWEQIDGGKPWTTARKVLMVIPIILFLLAAHQQGYEPSHMAFNALLTAILVIAKLPEMMGVRFFNARTHRQ